LLRSSTRSSSTFPLAKNLASPDIMGDKTSNLAIPLIIPDNVRPNNSIMPVADRVFDAGPSARILDRVNFSTTNKAELQLGEFLGLRRGWCNSIYQLSCTLLLKRSLQLNVAHLQTPSTCHGSSSSDR